MLRLHLPSLVYRELRGHSRTVTAPQIIRSTLHMCTYLQLYIPVKSLVVAGTDHQVDFLILRA